MSKLPEAVVLFGASGFIGRNILDALQGKVGKIIGVTANGKSLPGCEIFAFGHIGEIPSLSADTIAINVAAYRYNAATFRNEQSTILDVNTRITTGFYHFCAERGIREVRLASSSAVYPAAWDLLDDERAIDFNLPPHVGEAGYAWSKRFAEICADLHHALYGINTLTFRLTNPYGPFDSLNPDHSHVASAFVMRAISPGDTFEIRGNANAERDFVFSSDVAAVFLTSLAGRGEHAAYNLGAGTGTTVRQLAEAAIRVSGIQKRIIVADTSTGGVSVRRVSAKRIRSTFAVPLHSLDEGLSATIRWYHDALRI